MLAALDAAEEEVAAIAGLRSGRVRLMAFPSASATLVPRALSLVKARFPDVQITFTEAEPPESLAALKAGECDLAVAFAYEGTDLGRGEEDLDQFVITPLLDDEVRLAVPEGHAVSGQDSVDLADLSGEPWIAGCPRCRGHLLQLTHNAGFRPDVAYETEDYVAVMGLVAEGLGVALIPDLILRTVHHRDVVALPMTPGVPPLDHGRHDARPAAGAGRRGHARGPRRERRVAVDGADRARPRARLVDLTPAPRPMAPTALRRTASPSRTRCGP